MDEFDADDIQRIAQAATVAARSPGSSRAPSPSSSSPSTQQQVQSAPQQPPQPLQPTPQQLKQQREAANRKAGGTSASVPWGDFLKSPPVWAVTVAHFCFNWGYYTLLAWLPSYFEMALGLNVQESSFLTLIPYVAMIAMTPVVSAAAAYVLLTVCPWWWAGQRNERGKDKERVCV